MTVEADRARSNFAARDIESLLHPYTKPAQLRRDGPLLLDRADGVHVVDGDGRRLLEGMSGLWCAGLGFSEPALIDAADAQLRALPYYHLFAGRSFEPAVALAERLKELISTRLPHAPIARPGARVFYGSSGSEANDTQIKLAWYLSNARGEPKRKKIISRWKAYHGVTIVSASLTGLPRNHQAFDLPVDRILHTSSPHYWRGAEPGESESAFVARIVGELRLLIEAEGPETIAAMIAEPVMGAGGVIIPPEGYWSAVQDVLDAYGIRLIADEVITGFGRLGAWFGAERVGMRPHAMSFAKQLTGAYAPLSAVVVDAETAEALDAQADEIGVFGHGFTYGGHPLGCAVGVKALEIYSERAIPDRVRRLEPIFLSGLQAHAEHPIVGEARGVGLVGALELAPDSSGQAAFAPAGVVGARFAEEMLARGVIVRAIGDAVAFCPPMVIGEEGLQELFAPVGPSLDATEQWARAQGFLS